jgi:hypothetical protein
VYNFLFLVVQQIDLGSWHILYSRAVVDHVLGILVEKVFSDGQTATPQIANKNNVVISYRIFEL